MQEKTVFGEPRFFLAFLLLFTLIPAGNVQAASGRTGEYQKRYKAQASFPIWLQPAYGLVINRIKNGKIRFQISKAGVNGSPIYNTNIIRTSIKKNKASFQWKDTWGNSGTGKLKLSPGLCETESHADLHRKMEPFHSGYRR